MTADARAEEIEALIADFQRSGLRELHIRFEGLELYLSSDPDAPGIDVRETGAIAPGPVTPSPDRTSAAEPTPSAGTDAPSGSIVVKAPYLGTFYRAPKPGAVAFVEVGAVVEPETDLCLVEVMKLFTAVRAGATGVVHAILAKDGQMVEAGQALFVIAPA